MGLKGKIEAIIYAAEEPITLEQIAFLMKEPVLQELAIERQNAAEALERAAQETAESGVPEIISSEIGVPTLRQAQNRDDNALSHDAPDAGLSPDASTAELSAEAPAAELSPSEPAAEPDTLATEETEAEPASESLPAEPVAEPSEATTVEAKDAADVPEASLEDVKSEEADAGATTEAPVTEASEKAKPAVAPKRRKYEVPPEVKARVRALIEELVEDCANNDRGMDIRHVAGGYRMATKPEHHDIVKAFAKSLKPPLRLSLPALETLAVVAYKQPVTAPEVGEIRGVDSQGVMATLLERKLVTTAGRKAVIGRPILYKTTKEFLLRFGMNDVSELPSMEEFEKLAQEQSGLFIAESEAEPALSPEEASARLEEASAAAEEGSGVNEDVSGEAEAESAAPERDIVAPETNDAGEMQVPAVAHEETRQD